MNLWWWQTIDSITVMIIALAKIAGVVYLWSHEFYWGAALLLILAAYSNSKIPSEEKEKPEQTRTRSGLQTQLLSRLQALPSNTDSRTSRHLSCAPGAFVCI